MHLLWSTYPGGWRLIWVIQAFFYRAALLSCWHAWAPEGERPRGIPIREVNHLSLLPLTRCRGSPTLSVPAVRLRSQPISAQTSWPGTARATSGWCVLLKVAVRIDSFWVWTHLAHWKDNTFRYANVIDATVAFSSVFWIVVDMLQKKTLLLLCLEVFPWRDQHSILALLGRVSFGISFTIYTIM